MVALGQRLRAAREVAGLRQSEAALVQWGQLRQAYIAKQEAGLSPVSDVDLAGFGKLYQVSAPWLETEDGSPSADSERAAAVLTRLAAIREGRRARVHTPRSDDSLFGRSRFRLNAIGQCGCEGRRAPSDLDQTRRAALSDLIRTNDVAGLDTTWMDYLDLIEIVADSAGDFPDHCGGRSGSLADQGASADVAGATPLGEAVLRRAWRLVPRLLFMGADPLCRQRVPVSIHASLVTPWMLALDLGAPVRDVLFPMLLAAVQISDPDALDKFQSDDDEVFRSFGRLTCVASLDLDVRRLHQRVCTRANGRDGERLHELACRWTGIKPESSMARVGRRPRRRDLLVAPQSAVATTSRHQHQFLLLELTPG